MALKRADGYSVALYSITINQVCLKSVFMQNARFNKPQMKKTLKTSFVYLSFEDEIIGH